MTTLGRIGTLVVFGGITIVCARALATPDLLVGSWAANSIRRYDTVTGAYLGNFVPPNGGGLDLPDGMDFGPDGKLYVSSSNSNSILRYDGTSGAFLDVFATGLSAPGNLQFGPDGLLYVCNKNTGEVLRFDAQSGNLVDSFVTGGGLQQPVGLLWDEASLLVSDFSGSAIRRYDASSGAFIENFATVSTPLILNHDLNGNILVSSHATSRIWRYDSSGVLQGSVLNGGPVNCPVGFVFSDTGELIVASWQNNRLLRYDSVSGDFLNVFAIGSGLALPNDLLFMRVPEPSGFVVLMCLFGFALCVVRRSLGEG